MSRKKERKVVFSMLAGLAYDSLPTASRVSMDRLVGQMRKDIFGPELSRRIRKQGRNGSDSSYSLDVGTKFRAFLEVTDEQILVLDIVNHQAYKAFFSVAHA